jgi:hypothetical protein
MFLQVQAQTRGTRDASLALLTELSRRQPLLAPRAQDDR